MRLFEVSSKSGVRSYFKLNRNKKSPEQPKILTINAWNEWTEGSYLEPDTVNGYGYLQAIKRVFG